MGDHLHPVQRSGRAIGSVHSAASLTHALTLLADGQRQAVAGMDLLLDLVRGGPGEPVDLVDLSAITDGSFDAIRTGANA